MPSPTVNPIEASSDAPAPPGSAQACTRSQPSARSNTTVPVSSRRANGTPGDVRRLLTGTFVLLRAEGCERVQACAAPGGAGASLLASVGFTVGHGTGRGGGRSRLVLPL